MIFWVFIIAAAAILFALPHLALGRLAAALARMVLGRRD